MPRAKQFDEAAVLQKAMVLFWEKGYHDTSIEDLVQVLGINRGSLYDTFGGKRQLYGKAFDLYRFSNLNGMRAFLRTQEDVKAGIRQIFEKITHDDFSDDGCKGCFVVNTTTELLPADGDMHKVVRDHREGMKEAFLTFLQQGVEKGQISPGKDLEAISALLYTVMTGLRVDGKTKPPTATSMAAVDALLTLLD